MPNPPGSTVGFQLLGTAAALGLLSLGSRPRASPFGVSTQGLRPGLTYAAPPELGKGPNCTRCLLRSEVKKGDAGIVVFPSTTLPPQESGARLGV